MRPNRPADHSSEPGAAAWRKPSWGLCAVCTRPGPLVRHHVITENHVRRAGGDPWDMRNALSLGMHCACHRDHHQAARRIPLAKVPDDALAFAVDLFGEAYAADYFTRFYR